MRNALLAFAHFSAGQRLGAMSRSGGISCRCKEDTEETCCNKQTEFLMPQSAEENARKGQAAFHTTSRLFHGEEGVERLSREGQ